MKRIASALLCSVIVTACHSAPKVEPASYRDPVERAQAEVDAIYHNNALLVCGKRGVECVEAQEAATGRVRALSAQARGAGKWFDYDAITWRWPEPATGQRSFLIGDIISQGKLANTRNGATNYVEAEKWINATLALRGVVIEPGCLLRDRVSERGYWCLDYGQRKFVPAY